MFLQHALSCHVCHRSLLFIPIKLKFFVTVLIVTVHPVTLPNLFTSHLALSTIVATGMGGGEGGRGVRLW